MPRSAPPGAALTQQRSARGPSSSRSTQTSNWHSAGGSSPIADARCSLRTVARIPSFCRTFFA
jgi:hypothetical protein